MLARLKLGSAFRYSRNVVGGVTGFIFSLGNIFKTPFQGIGPSAYVAAFGLALFAIKVRGNYQQNRSDLSIADYKNEKMHHSTAMIARKLTSDSQIYERFKAKYCSVENMVQADQLEEILDRMLNEQFANPKSFESSVSQYLHCSGAFFAQTGSHFMECLLAKAYANPTLFTFASLATDNFLVVLLLLPALYNGYQNFNEAYQTYEKSHIDDLAEAFSKRICGP